MSDRVPPMLQQYRRIKGQYSDALVLFRLGDFYELFEEDARTASRQLGLVLTSRSFGKGIRLPMAGVPHQHVTRYIARLLEQGHKVAVVEQLEDPRRVRRLVKRDVVRVITPGTVVEDALLPDRAENYLAALALQLSNRTPDPASPLAAFDFGLALVDLSTGDFAVTQIEGPQAWELLVEELSRTAPSEYVLPESALADEVVLSILKSLGPARLSPLDDAHFDHATAQTRLLRHFGVVSLEAFGCAALPLAIAAAGGALHYLQINQSSDPSLRSGQALAHLRSLQTYSLAQYMLLDPTTRRNLELTHTLRDGRTEGSLLGTLDHTHTAMGRRLLRRWLGQPLLDLDAIQARLDAVEELVKSALLRADLRTVLDGIHDLERLIGRVGFGNANARDLVALKQDLSRLPRLKALLANVAAPRLRQLYSTLEDLQDVARLISAALVDHPPIHLKDGGLIRTGFDADLDALRDAAASGRAWLSELEVRERQRTGLKSLRVRYNEVFGFFLEVPRSQAHLVPPEYERKATISHAERFVSPELKAREAEILSAEERSDDLEYDLFIDLRQQVAAHTARVQSAARILAELDALAALAEAAARYGYVRPIVDDSTVLDIRQGRHPTVERLLPEGERFVPNDAHLDADERLLIITGPNMSGKSVLVRQVALIALLAQIGSFVPAESAHVGLVDRIFTRAGATDDIACGRSTFLVEMSETAYILGHATPRSLVVLDEVGRGTSTYDGVSLAWAVAEDLHDVIGCRSLFATHYHELTALAARLPGVHNYTMAIAERGHEIIFLRRVVPGGADRSYGIQVARLAGLPERVVERAREVLAGLERSREEAAGEELRGTLSLSEAKDQGNLVPSLRSGQALERSEGSGELRGTRRDLWKVEEAKAAEAQTVYQVETGEPLQVLPVPEAVVWEVLHGIFSVDIANMTPVQALVLLNALQGRLRGRSSVDRTAGTMASANLKRTQDVSQ